jgi:hypothetical protein
MHAIVPCSITLFPPGPLTRIGAWGKNPPCRLAILCAVCLPLLAPPLSHAQPPSASPVSASTASIAGVKPGMTKQQAIAALKAFDPGLEPVEVYSVFQRESLSTLPKIRLDHLATGFFTQIVAIPRREIKKGRPGPITGEDLEFYNPGPGFGEPGCPELQTAPDSVVYHILFSPDLSDPRVVLVDENRSYCSKEVATKSVFEKLYDRYSKNVVSKLNVRSDGYRLTSEDGTGDFLSVASLDWRLSDKQGVRILIHQPHSPIFNNNYNQYEDLGNAGGGIAVHAELYPTPAWVYLKGHRVVLWDDDAMANYYKRVGGILSELDRLDINIDKLGDKQLLAKVKPWRDPNLPPPEPEAASGAPPFDAYVIKAMSFPLMAPGGLTVPEGTGLYSVSELGPTEKRFANDRPSTWFTFDPAFCGEHKNMRVDCSHPIALNDEYWKPTKTGKPSVPALVSTKSAAGSVAARSTNRSESGSVNTVPPQLPGPNVGDKWTGHYMCTQGDTGLDVTITGRSGQQIQARVDFYSVADTKIKIQPAAYSAQGALQPDGGLTLSPVSWIVRPAPYFMGTLAGHFDPDFSGYYGLVPECGRARNFMVRRVAQNVGAVAISSTGTEVSSPGTPAGVMPEIRVGDHWYGPMTCGASTGRVDVYVDSFNGRQLAARLTIGFNVGTKRPPGITSWGLSYDTRGNVSSDGNLQLNFVRYDVPLGGNPGEGTIFHSLLGTFTAEQKFTGSLPDCTGNQNVSLQLAPRKQN